jgi:hydrogenase/urease accessory protein HupE
MAEPAFCSSCGAALTPGASACASCGRLTATQTATQTGSCIGVIVGAFAGLFLGTAFGMAISSIAGFNNYSGCGFHASPHAAHAFPIAAVLGVAGVLAAILFLVYGLRLAQTNKPGVGAAIMAGASAFLLPATPCTLFAVFTRC